MVATPSSSGVPASSLAAATRASAAQERSQPEEADERLRVAAAANRRVELGERQLDYLDALVLIGRGAFVVEVRGHEEMAFLVREAGRGVEARQVLPAAGALADLLGELALGGVERAFALLVQLAGRQLEQGGVVHRLARLSHEVDLLAVVGDHPHRAWVLDDLPLGLRAVVIAEAVDPDLGDPALPDHLPADPLHQSSSVVCAALSAACLTSDTVTSSIVSSACMVTDSSGWWLRSVPFARFTTGNPAGTKTLASLPLAVAM